jgi:hypothetical protein
MTTSPPPKPGSDAFHRERSKAIDAFAALEESIVRLLVALKAKFGTESFGQKLQLLKTAKANPQFSQARLRQVQALLPRCEELNELRNDIVHSRLQIAIIGDDHRACFTNTRHCLSGSQTARLFTLEGLRSVTGNAGKLAEELRQI